MDSKEWRLEGTVQRVVKGLNKHGQAYEMISVGGHKFWLEDGLRGQVLEGDRVTVRGRYIRDVRTPAGFEAVQELTAIEASPGSPDVAPQKKVAGV